MSNPFFLLYLQEFLHGKFKKKLRLEDIKIDSFVTSTRVDSTTVAGNSGGMCGASFDGNCNGNTDWTGCYCNEDTYIVGCTVCICTAGCNNDVVDTENYTPLQSIMGPSCQFGVCPGGRTTPHPDPNVYCS